MATDFIEDIEAEQQAAPPKILWEAMGHSQREVNVGLLERAGSFVAGAALTAGGIYLLKRNRPIAGIASGILGGMLIQRGVTGHCNAYQALGINRADATRTFLPIGKPISVEESVTIRKPASELYSFWRDFRNLPRIMRYLQRIDVVSDEKSRWVAEGPGGQLIEWEARITMDRPGEFIAWKTTENAAVPNRGSVRFRPASGNLGTIVEVMLEYQPPAGAVGAAIAKLLGREPAQEIREDLARFKAEMEARAQPAVEGQPVAAWSGAGI